MLIVLDKSFVAEHLRYLKSGKSVKVQAHYTKRVKKHTEHAPPHNYNLDHLSEKDRDLFNRMHAEQHVAHFYDGHALRKRVAHHEGEAQKHNDHADQLDKDGKHKEAAAARRKADKHIAEMHRHKTELRKVDNAVHGLAAMKERLVAGSGTLDGDAEAIHQHYVSKVGERLKPANKPAAPLVVLNSPKDGDRNADGLVFRNGRWHRDDFASDGQANSADNSALVDYAKETAGRADSKRRFFDAVIGRFSSENTSNEHRQALFDALGLPKGAKVDDFRAALDSYYDANKGERKKRHLNNKQALAESNVRKVMQQAKEVYQQDRSQFESETDTSPSHADDKAEAKKQAQELAEMKQEAPASVAANPSPSTKPAAEDTGMPSGAVMTTKTLVVQSVGRKWLTVTAPGKSFKMQLAITPETKHLKAGDKVENMAVGEVKESSRYGTTVKLYPASEAAAEEARQKAARAEVERWVGFVEQAAKEGYVYKNGVTKLRELNYREFPDLEAKVDAAIKKVADQKEEEKKARAAASQQPSSDSAKGKILYPVGKQPELNKPVRMPNGGVFVFTGHGKPFRINESHPSLYGSHLLGHEGDMGRYSYFRPATQDEIASLDAAPAAVPTQSPPVVVTKPAEPMTLRQQLDEVQRKYDQHQRFFNEGGYGYNPHAQRLNELKDLVHREAVAKREKELLDNAEEYKKRWNAAVQKYAVNGQIKATDMQKVAAEAGLTLTEKMWLKGKMQRLAAAPVTADHSPEAKPEPPAAPLVVVAKPEAPKPNATALAAAKAALEQSKGQTRVKVPSGGGSNFDSFENWVSDMYDLQVGLMSPEDKAEKFKAYQAAKKESGAKSERAVLSEAAAAAKLNAVSKGGVALKGTPKQREWAEKIRQQRLSALTPEQVAIAVDPNGLFVNAKWWIETRDMDARQLGAFFEAQKKMLALARKQQAANAASDYAETVKIYNGLTGQFGFGRAERGKDYLQMARQHLAKFPA